ncbi:DnaJ-domain-containing protein [Neoconidiobolus thromboides FSU 785]|nr:DnaJ-domain-containing protein [Neoconidiobolus thromboides FSU 785]
MLTKFYRPIQHLSLRLYSSKPSENYYDLLKIKKTSTKSEIKTSFYRLSMQYHPDKNPNNESAHAHFLKINEAYSILSDDTKRLDYDRSFISHNYSKEQAFSNRFRYRQKPTAQYGKTKPYHQKNTFKDGNQMGKEYNQGEYEDMHGYSSGSGSGIGNTPFRFQNRYHQDERPNIETSSHVWGRMTSVFVMMCSCWFIVSKLSNNNNNEYHKKGK